MKKKIFFSVVSMLLVTACTTSFGVGTGIGLGLGNSLSVGTGVSAETTLKKKEDKKIEENKEKVAPVKKSTPKKVGEQNVIKANKTDTVDTTVKRVKQERQE